ncbi:MAG: tetratricopeptide repeat protein [Candidatus Brocadiia bacterium]
MGAEQNDPHEPEPSAGEVKLLEKAEEAAREEASGAIEIIEEGLDADSSAALPFALGVYRREEGELRAAADAFGDALERKDDFHRARMNLIGTLFECEDYDAAAGHLVRLTDSEYGREGEVWKLLGYAHLMNGAAVGAEEAYRRAAIYRPDDPDVASGLIQALIKQDRVDAARAVAVQELKRRPMDRELWMFAVNADLERSRPEKAIVRLETARRLGVLDEEGMLTLGDLYLKEDLYAGAVNVYQEVAALEDPPPERLVRAVEAFLNLGQPEKASQLLDAWSGPREESLPEAIRARLLRAQGRLCEEEKDREGALEFYDRALRLDPLDAETLLRAGNVLRQEGELEAAVVKYERCARQNEEYRARAYVRLAQIHVERDRLEKAVELLRKALEIEERGYIRDYLREVERAIQS